MGQQVKMGIIGIHKKKSITKVLAKFRSFFNVHCFCYHKLFVQS